MSQHTQKKEGILELLKRRPVVGDGGYILALEKRGYVLAGFWTPEVTVEYPEAVEELHREYVHAGADVLTSFSFNSTEEQLKVTNSSGSSLTVEAINQAACDILKRVAAPTGVLTAGGISPTPTFALTPHDPQRVKQDFSIACQIFVRNQLDFLLAEFFCDVREIVLAIEAMKETGLPVAATMRIGPAGDDNGVTPGECAVRMARAGADIVGVNCSFDPMTCVTTMRLMKEALEAEGLHAYLMMQPAGYHSPDCVDIVNGYHNSPEWPFALESRQLTRWDVRQAVREARKLGVHYIGGCCGYEPYHIREISSELRDERGFGFPAEDKYRVNADSLKYSAFPPVQQRNNARYWEELKPASGRPHCPKVSQPIKVTAKWATH